MNTTQRPHRPVSGRWGHLFNQETIATSVVGLVIAVFLRVVDVVTTKGSGSMAVVGSLFVMNLILLLLVYMSVYNSLANKSQSDYSMR